MAEEKTRDDLEKSEEPTPKRREDARKKGQVPRSRYAIPAATLLAVILAIYFGGVELLIRMERLIIGFFSLAGAAHEFNREQLFSFSLESGLLVAPVLLPIFGGVVLSGMGSGLLQTGFLWTVEPLGFKFSRLNPISGFRRLFSLDSVADMLKALLSIVGIGLLGAFILYNNLAALTVLSGLGVPEIVAIAGQKAAVLLGAAVSVVTVLAIADYLYQRWRTESKLRMSRQEVKEEFREQEGDPLIRAQLKSLRQKMARRRMMADVAKADVIITNPQSLAVALRYRPAEMSAPRVLGKGAGYIAQKIREIAREKSIPIVENKPLARLLYRQVEIGQEIPESLYRTVAEILAYVYRLRRGPAESSNRSKRLNVLSGSNGSDVDA